MQNLSVLVCSLFLVAGCSDKWDKAISQMDGFKDKMCACKDKACTDGVEKEVSAWESTMKDTFKKDEKPPEKLIEKGDKIEKEMRECRKAVGKTAGAAEAAAKLKKLTDSKDQMCAGKDTACAPKVSDAMTKWARGPAKKRRLEGPTGRQCSKRRRGWSARR